MAAPTFDEYKARFKAVNEHDVDDSLIDAYWRDQYGDEIPEVNTSFGGDLVDAFQEGFLNTAADTAQGVTLGEDNFVSDFLRDWGEEQRETMRPESAQAMQETGFDDDLSLKENSSLKGGAMQLASGMGSLPVFMGLGGAGGVTLKAASHVGKLGRVARAVASKPGLASPKMLSALSRAEKATDAVAYGTVGGAMIGGGTSSQIKEEILNAPIEDVFKADGFRPIFERLQKENPDKSTDELLRSARDTFAEEVSTSKFDKGFMVGLLSMGVTGGLFERVLTGRLAAGRLANSAVGAGTEAAQELIEGGSQQYLANEAAIESIDPNRDPMDKVVGTAVTGAVIGGAIGGGLGAVTGGRGSETKTTEEEDEETRSNVSDQIAGAVDNQVQATVADAVSQVEEAGGDALDQLAAAETVKKETDASVINAYDTASVNRNKLAETRLAREQAKTAKDIDAQTEALTQAQTGLGYDAEGVNLGVENEKQTETEAAQEDTVETVAQEGVGEKTDLASAASEAASSPENNLTEPTEGQKEAGNYKKGHVTVNGLDISIENPKGSTRSGTDTQGNKWSNEIKSHYGYIKGTVGNDKDHVDTFISDNAETNKSVHVIDQIDPDTGKFDEHKVMLGYGTEEAATAAYNENYNKGWKGLGAITEMPSDTFKEWVNDENNTTQPANKAALESEVAIDAVEQDEAKTKAYDPGVVSLANELSEGGGVGYVRDADSEQITGRTPSLNPEWYKDNSFEVKTVKGDSVLAKSPSVKKIKEAISAHEQGKELTRPQKRILEALDGIVVESRQEAEDQAATAEQGSKQEDSQEARQEPSESEEKAASSKAEASQEDESLLKGYDEDELRQREREQAAKEKSDEETSRKAEEKRQADKEVDGFQLTGSDLPADANAKQNDIFDQPKTKTPLDELYLDGEKETKKVTYKGEEMEIKLNAKEKLASLDKRISALEDIRTCLS